jgi:tetratricopeptide (TPR) repeat protein
VRQDWQNNRDQIRNDWQEHRDEAREDWQNWFGDHYGRYGGWYAGYAPGYWGRWDYLWDQYPAAAAVGLTWWAANSLAYGLGYWNYANPYYEESMPVYYTEPVITLPIEPASETSAPAAPEANSDAVAKFDQARASFYDGRYDEALKLTDAAIALMPHDAVLHEFRSLVLFALGRYAESAAAIHPVLAVGPGWDWKTLSSLYRDGDTYTTQLRALESAGEKNPKAGDVRFLLGYHYLTCGYLDEALAQFRAARQLHPEDLVSASLVATLSPREAAAGEPPDAQAPKPVGADEVVGQWAAAGPKAAKFSMDLGKDGTFTWGFTQGKRKEQVKGVYTITGNVLAMEPDTGGTVLAELTMKGADSVNFKIIGGAADDRGLEFRRGH